MAANNNTADTIIITAPLFSPKNILKTILLAMAPILPAVTTMHIAIAPTDVGNCSTTMLPITIFPVAIEAWNTELTIKMPNVEDIQYMERELNPPNSIVSKARFLMLTVPISHPLRAFTTKAEAETISVF